MSHHSNLSVHGRGLPTRPPSSQSIHHPSSPVPNSPTPSSPSIASGSSGGIGGNSASAGAVSPFYSHPSSPVSRFNGGTILSLAQSQGTIGGGGGGSGFVGPSPTALISSTLTGGGKFTIQRPLASRVGPAHSASFQHSIHPTAVQASHSIGQHGKTALTQPSSSASNIANGNSSALDGTTADQSKDKFSNTRPSALNASGSHKKLPTKDWYGTFPRLGSATRGMSPGTSVGALGMGGESLIPASPVRASPNPIGGRSPEPYTLSAHASPITLHPRPRTGSTSLPKAGLRTPPSRSGKTKPVRRNSDQSVDVGEIGASLQDMDLADETPTSGYNSDVSIDSHASFAVDSTYVGTYGQEDAGGQEIDPELADVSDTPYRTGYPASPLQLRAGAPPPSKMYGNYGSIPSTPARGNSAGGLTPNFTFHGHGAATPGSGSNSGLPQRSGSRLDSSADNSALQSPQLDGYLSTKPIPFGLSPLPPLDPMLDMNMSNVDKPPTPVLLPPSHTAVPPQGCTAVPALNLPKAAKQMPMPNITAQTSTATLAPTTITHTALLPSLHSPSYHPDLSTSLSQSSSTVSLSHSHSQRDPSLPSSGASSAFSSARSIGLSLTGRSNSNADDGMDWQSTPTARSESSTTGSHSNSMTSLGIGMVEK